MALLETDRMRLGRILGMLGSDSPGERDNAARQAERLRRSLGASWDDLLADRVQFIDCWIPPSPALWPAHAPPASAPIVQRCTLREKLDLPIWWIALCCFTIGLAVGHIF